MKESEKLKEIDSLPLRHCYDNWWKLDGEYVWLLAGRYTPDQSQSLKPGWYFSDESEGMNGPYLTRSEAYCELQKYCDYYLRPEKDANNNSR